MREQILAMEPGRELDALVALKIMGYVPSDMRDGWVKIGALATYPKRYSTDISAAWEVVEKMRDSNKRAFTNELYEIMNPNREAFQISPIDLIWYMNPLNICKAALLVVIDF